MPGRLADSARPPRAIAAFGPSSALEITSPAFQAAPGQAPEEARPEGLHLRRTDVQADDLAPAFGVHLRVHDAGTVLDRTVGGCRVAS